MLVITSKGDHHYCIEIQTKREGFGKNLHHIETVLKALNEFEGENPI